MKLFLLHILSIFIAVVLVYFTINTKILSAYLFSDVIEPSIKEHKIKESGLYMNYDRGNHIIRDICLSLDFENSITIIGSSELTGKDKLLAKPFNFIPRNTGFNSLAIGHAGNQCFSVFSQLAAFNKFLNDAKIVIIVSPGWFTGSYAYGTSVESFLEFNNQKVLSNIYKDSEVPEEYKNYIFKYVHDNFDDINAPSNILKLMNYRFIANNNIIFGIFYAPLILFSETFLHLKSSVIKRVNNKEFNIQQIGIDKNIISRNKLINKTNKIDWKELYDKAIKYERSIATNNNWGINNEYFTKYIQGEKKKITNISLKNNQELNDFDMLLKLLDYYSVDPVFIIQPLNPFAYKNLHELGSITDIIEQRIVECNYPVLNMFVSDTVKYEKDILTDIMHLSLYGWYKIDKFIIENYLFDEKKHY